MAPCKRYFLAYASTRTVEQTSRIRAFIDVWRGINLARQQSCRLTGCEQNPVKSNTLITKSLFLYALLTATSFAGATLAPVDAVVNGDVVRGKTLYQGCQGCHSIDENDLGPRHRGVVGRHAGSVEDYSYSMALKNSALTWDEATLDRWLTNPSALVPGTKMFFKIDDAQSRADIIAYLKQLK
jgi:cytochrome c